MNGGITDQKTQYQNWAVVAILLMLAATMAAVHQFKIPTVMAGLMSTLGMTLEQSSLSMSIITFVGIFLSLPGGGLTQKLGPKNTILVAAVFMAAGSLVGAFSTSGGVFIFSRGIEGVGYILFTLCGPIAIAQFVQPEKIGIAMGIYTTWVSVGQVIASNLTPRLFDSGGLRGAWSTYAVLSLITGFLVFFVIKTRNGAGADHGAGAAEQSAPKARTSEVFQSRDLMLFCLAYITFNVILMYLLTHVYTCLTESGMDPATASFATSLPMLLGIVAGPLFGAISDKMGSTKGLYLISLFAMLPGALMMFSSTGSLMYLGAAIIGLAGMAHPAMVFASIGKVIPKPELAGTSVGLLIAFSQVGMFVGPMLLSPFLRMGGNWMGAAMFLIPISVLGLAFGALAKFK